MAFTGFASFFSRGYVKAAMELFSFVFMLFLGVKFLIATSVSATNPIEERIEGKLHPHSAFLIGFVRVMGNPGVLIFWIILAANFISREWVSPDWPGKVACVAGVALGTGLWFMTLSWFSSMGQGKFSERTLIKMEHFSGILLIALALIHGGTIVWQMHKANLLPGNSLKGGALKGTGGFMSFALHRG